MWLLSVFNSFSLCFAHLLTSVFNAVRAGKCYVVHQHDNLHTSRSDVFGGRIKYVGQVG